MRLLISIAAWALLSNQALSFSASSLFGLAPSNGRSSNVVRFMESSQPSDSSSDAFYVDDDDTVTVESEDFTPTEAEATVTSVLDLIPTTLGGDVSETTRAQINEVLLKLEALNPTPQPATSPLLNGVWELRYAAGYSADGALPSPTRELALFLYSGGYSPGLFALSLAQKLPSNLVTTGDLEIAISREQPRIEAKIDVKLFGSNVDPVLVQAKLNVESGIRLRETYTSATLFNNQSFELPEQLQYGRDIYVTYLDEDLLVVRDGSGIPEVLVRKEKTFSKQWGTEPGDEDMTAPGEES